MSREITTVLTGLSYLLVDETFGNRITAFDLTGDGELTNRRAWATFGDLPNDRELPAALGHLVVAPTAAAWTSTSTPAAQLARPVS
ncbi:MAG: hypothetical protein ABSB76_01675 [Streptosporangiaceae bacterium]|jgi:hypothetical protein